MTRDLETALRESLRRHADDAPDGAAILSTVETAALRRRRRVAALGTAACVLAVAVGAGVLQRVDQRPDPSAIAPALPAAPPATAGASMPANETPIRVGLAAGSALAVRLPYTPPPGAGEPLLLLERGCPTLRHALAPQRQLTMTVCATPPEAPANATRSPVTVRGGDGTVLEWAEPGSGTQRALLWRDGAQRWVHVVGDAPEPVEVLRGFAEALIDKPVAKPASFTFALVPDGFPVNHIGPASVAFRAPGAAPAADFARYTVLVSLSDGRDVRLDGRPITVAGRPAALNPTPEATMLRVDLGNATILDVQVSADLRFSEADLIRFAGGIAVAPGTPPTRG